MTAYAMYYGQVLREVTGVEIDGTPYSIEEIKAALKPQDRLPKGHVVLEQAEYDATGRVAQTVRDAEGREYERIVSGEEAYGDDPS